ncbi:MAG: TMEM43 family protein [Thalassobaculum sp.]|uniref:TMEM43 family protein n=1 Tax=Thalassobaculum sp. TaxID=2022740 RepID=UPI0032EAE528
MREDSFTEVSEKSWASRLGGSLAGALVGVLLFAGSFFVLVWNEGRAVDAIVALDAGAGMVVVVPADRVDPANDGRLIHVSGPATVTAPLVDPVFKVGGDRLLRLERRVEMYQWREDKETSTETGVGGKETTRTTYSYVTGWSEAEIDSSTFRRPEGHGNPRLPYRSQTLDARPVRLGAYTLGESQIRQIDDFEPLPVDGDAALPAGFRRDGEAIVRGAPESPQVGDLRILFQAVPAQTVSVVARQAAGGLTAYRAANGHVIELVRTGAHDAESMFREAKAEEALFTWILRAAGFLMMLVGIALLASPLTWLASVLPFLASIVGFAAFGIALIAAVPLTLLTIALSWLAFRPLIAGGLIVAAVVLMLAIRRLVPRRRSAAPAPAET